MARLTNLVQNGRAKYTSGTVEVRRNLATNPNLGTDASGWVSTAGATLTRVENLPEQGGGFAGRIERTADGAGNEGMHLGLAIPVTEGQTITASFEVLSSSQTTVTPRLLWSIGATVSASPVQMTTVYQRVSITATVPTGVTTLRVNPLFTDMLSGTATRVCRVLIEISSTVNSYFDGSYSPDPDLTPSWTGTANASASVLTGTAVASIPATALQARNISSSQWPDSGQSVRSIPSSEKSNDSFCSPGGDVGAMRLGLIAGLPTAVRARGYLPTSQTGTISNNARRIKLIYKAGAQYIQVIGTQGPNVPGEFISQVVATLPSDSSEAFVRLCNGAFVGNGDVYWTNIIIAQADTEAEALAAVQTYFDGDTPPFHYGELAQLVVPKWSGTAGQSSSYFDYELPWTVGIKWDQSMDRRFELGVDRGVLYNRSMVGVPWNGLVNVTEKLTNTELTRYYQDGTKYYTDQSKPEFSATLQAYTYPDIFETFSGKTQVVEGLYADEASFGLFHFSYRTKVGDAVYGPDKFYKIHLVYNAYAIPSDRSYGTVNESPSASTFSWDITTDAIAFTPGSNSTMTSHLIIDSRKISATKLKNLETILYGTSAISPRLPLPAEVRTILA